MRSPRGAARRTSRAYSFRSQGVFGSHTSRIGPGSTYPSRTACESVRAINDRNLCIQPLRHLFVLAAIEAAEWRAERTQRLAEEVDRSIDFLTWQLRPAALDHLGLSAALRNLVTGWSERFGIAADFDVADVEDVPLRRMSRRTCIGSRKRRYTTSPNTPTQGMRR